MTQPTAYDRDGVPLAPEQVDEALRSGNAGFQPGAQIWMRDPTTGEDRVMSPGEARQAAQDGFSFLPGDYVEAVKEQASRRREFDGGLGNIAATAAEGVASGASFGLYDDIAARGAFGDEYLRGLRGRAEFNPGTRTAGEIGGAIAPMLLSGGAGAVGAGARTLGAAPLAVARGASALERGTMALLRGGGSSATGRILAHGASMGVGGAFEGAAYGAGSMLREAALTDQELTAEKLLSGAGEGALFGGLLSGGAGVLLGAGREGVRKVLGNETARGKLAALAEGQAFKQVTGGDLRAAKNVMRYGGEQRLQRIGRELLDEGVPMTGRGWQERAAVAVTKKLDDAASKMNEVAKQLDEAGARVNSANLVAKVDDQLAKMRSSTSGAEIKVAKKIESEFAPLRERALDIATTPQGGVAPELTFSEMWTARQKLDKLIDFASTKRSPSVDAMKELRATYNDAMDQALRNQPDLVKPWAEAKSKFSDYKTVSDALKRKTDSNLARAAIGTGDKLVGGAGAVLGALTGMGTGSFGVGALTSMGSGMALGAANRFLTDQGAGLIARAADRLSKMDARLSVAANRLSGAKSPPLSRTVVPTGNALVQQFNQTRREMNNRRDPEYLAQHMQRVTGGLAEHEPGLALAMQERVAGDAAYLQQRLPQGYSRAGSSLTADAEKTRYSRTDMAKFMRIKNALDAPEEVLDAVADGKIDYDALEAIKVRRPKLFASMRERVMAYTASSGETLPYSQRISLSLAFDFPADPSMRPENLQAIQASFEPPPDEKPGPNGKLDVTDQVKSMQLPGDATKAA